MADERAARKEDRGARRLYAGRSGFSSCIGDLKGVIAIEVCEAGQGAVIEVVDLQMLGLTNI